MRLESLESFLRIDGDEGSKLLDLNNLLSFSELFLNVDGSEGSIW